MHVGFFWCLLLVGSLQLVTADQVLDEGELIFVHVLYRHGDRTPIDPYPTDPYRDPKYWSTGFGQLTNAGKMHHYELGQWLRNRYNGILNETYSKDQIHVRSTDVDRTLMSAYSNLAGLYPPKGKDAWMPNLAWQPIPVHTEREKHDKLLAMKKECPAYEAALQKVKQSEEFREFNARYQEVYDYISLNSGMPIQGVEGASYVYSCLNIEEGDNKTLPEWTKQVYPEPLRYISARSFQTSTFTRYLARLKAGPLLQDILERFQNKTRKHSKRVMTVYSGHDTTVSSLLNTLRLFDPPHSPPFRACVMMELRVFLGVPYVSVVYKNDTEPVTLNIPNCGVTCPLAKMFQLYADVLPQDWEAECLTAPAYKVMITEMGYDVKTTMIVICASAGIMLMSLVIYSSFMISRRRRLYRELY